MNPDSDPTPNRLFDVVLTFTAMSDQQIERAIIRLLKNMGIWYGKIEIRETVEAQDECEG